MNFLKTIPLILILTGFTYKGGDDKHEYVYHVSFDSQTKVIINGSSNVNEFSCYYTGNFKDKTYCIYGALEGMVMDLRNAKFCLEVGNFDCGNPIMTSDFKKTLKQKEFPEISMEIQSIDFVCKKNIECKSSVVFANIQVTAGGQSKGYCIQADRNLINEGVKFSGNFDIEVEDFGIDPPTHAFGLVKVNSTMNIEFSFVFNEMAS